MKKLLCFLLGHQRKYKNPYCTRCGEERPLEEQELELNHADPENWPKLSALYAQLHTKHAIRYSYMKDRSGNTVFDSYDYRKMELYDALRLKYREKWIQYNKKTK